jgi:hypothetical protein
MSHPTRPAPRGDEDPFLRENARESEDADYVEHDEGGLEDDDEEEDDIGLVAWETTVDEEWDT